MHLKLPRDSQVFARAGHAELGMLLHASVTPSCVASKALQSIAGHTS
jgi:hypothetical protein